MLAGHLRRPVVLLVGLAVQVLRLCSFQGAGAPVVTPTNRVYRLDGVSAPASGLRLLVLDGLQMHGRYWDEDLADAA